MFKDFCHRVVVAIKPNLVYADPANKGVTTHPGIVSALIDNIRKITKGGIIVMEGDSQNKGKSTFKKLGWTKLCEEKNCVLLDLNHPAPYKDFGTYKVPGGGLYFGEVELNRELERTDVFISAAKMKMHSSAGITLSLKNQFGIAPFELYSNNPDRRDVSKAALHGRGELRDLPKVINDLNVINPINLAIIDGVIGLEGGEGYWIRKSAARRKSSLIIIGKNAVAVDAVGVFLMGYDPSAECPDEPFITSQNHLRIARDLGLGPNEIKDIDIRLGSGIEKLEDLVVKYAIPEVRSDVSLRFKPDKIEKLSPKWFRDDNQLKEE